MEQEKGTNLSAGCDAGSCKAGDTPQGEEEAIYESSLQLMRNRVPEKHVTADTKVSEVVFPKKPSKRTHNMMEKGNQISQVHSGSDKDVMSGTSETSSPSFHSALRLHPQQSSLTLDHVSSTDKKLNEPTQRKGTECPATADLSTLQPSTREDNDSDTSSEYWDMINRELCYGSSNTSDWISPFINRQDTDDEGIGSDIPSSTFTVLSHSLSISPPLCDLPCPEAEHLVLHDSTVTTQDASEVHPGGNSEGLMEMWFSLQQGSNAGSPSVPSQSKTSAAKTHDCTQSKSLPDLLYNTFTPVIGVDESDETYRFQCLCPGLYQCSVTGLVFHMEGDGDVVYRIVPWNRRLLAQHHQQPAGPLFDIKCPQQSVRQLYLPHCEVVPTRGSHFLSVAHVKDDSIEFIKPEQITETHVVINITGFSGFGNVKDENSPPDPVRALVLLFYKPPADPDLTSVLNVLLLPKNIVLRDVLRIRKKLVGDENYIETSPHCKLCPRQEYTLSTCPDDDSVLVQPTKAEFDCDNYDNYFPSFQVELDKVMKQIKLLLRDTISSLSVWERRVCLLSTGLKKSCGLNLPPNERLLDIRSSFISGISGPVLKSLLDKLFEKTVMTESERESADEMQNRRDKARFVIDTVRNKGEAASSEMIEFLGEADPFLSEYLGLT